MRPFYSNTLLLVFLTLIPTCFTCYPNQATGCPSYSLLATAKIIPIPDPSRLDENCRELQKGLDCLNGPGVFGSCDKHPMKSVYLTMAQVIQIPCSSAKEMYRSGRECFQPAPGSPLSGMMSKCHTKTQRFMVSNYCNGVNEFFNCVSESIMTIPGCDAKHRDVISAMIATHINSLAEVMGCEKVAVPDLSQTTTTTTTTTTITTSATPTTTLITAMVFDALTTKKTQPEVTKTEMTRAAEVSTNPSYRVGKTQLESGGVCLPATFFLPFCLASLLVWVMGRYSLWGNE